MTILHFQLHDGTSRRVEARNGESIMQSALNANVRGIDADCGGSCSCATCHVVVADTWISRLPEPDAFEDEMLDAVASGRQAGSRLACQILVDHTLDGITLTVPDRQS